MSSSSDAMLSAYPGRFTSHSADQWVSKRRALLVERATPAADLARTVSSGCAATGARAHISGLASDAAHALSRLDAGLGTSCEVCAATLPFDRLDSAPVAVRCTGCSRPFQVDTRWCR